MEIRTELNYLRIAPRKVRLVADAIRGKRLPEAERTLRFLTRRASFPIAKLLASAVANAKQNFQVTDPDTLIVRRITVDSGPTLKRSRPRAFGRTFSIRKRTSRVTLVLESRGASLPKRRRKKAEIAIANRDEPVLAAPETRGAGARREAFREKPKVVKKSTEFVQRMFRRKAI